MDDIVSIIMELRRTERAQTEQGRSRRGRVGWGGLEKGLQKQQTG